MELKWEDAALLILSSLLRTGFEEEHGNGSQREGERSVYDVVPVSRNQNDIK